MRRYVALLRAVNVAGHARMGNAELARIFTAAGARDVSSFGHAGNLLFSAARSPAAVVARARDVLGRRYGERPLIVVRSAAELRGLMAADPFARCGATPSDKLYVVFLARKARKPPALPIASSVERLTAFACLGRDVLLVSSRKPNGFYGFPNAFVETAFRVTATTRNWSTVTRLAKLLA
ncbi:MAG TPA: DUF1697 domain-containing protein [Gammaproteobacteria bacterium]|nr:DUF1697 domain-containing protein [Gammaproteobacteria bacterium]